jgi:hypothetical protein
MIEWVQGRGVVSSCHEGLHEMAAPARSLSRRSVAGILGIVAKYDPLFEYLCRDSEAPVSLTFDEVERLVGPLPASATRFKQWWENESTGGRHMHAKSWLNAGREVERVDLKERFVWFSAAAWRRGS